MAETRQYVVRSSKVTAENSSKITLKDRKAVADLIRRTSKQGNK